MAVPAPQDKREILVFWDSPGPWVLQDPPGQQVLLVGIRPFQGRQVRLETLQLPLRRQILRHRRLRLHWLRLLLRLQSP